MRNFLDVSGLLIYALMLTIIYLCWAGLMKLSVKVRLALKKNSSSFWTFLSLPLESGMKTPSFEYTCIFDLRNYLSQRHICYRSFFTHSPPGNPYKQSECACSLNKGSKISDILVCSFSIKIYFHNTFKWIFIYVIHFVKSVSML